MSDDRTDEYDVVEAGWGLSIEADGDELHVEHIESATTYVIGDDGSLTVPGGNPPDGNLHELQGALASALDDEGQEAAAPAGTAQCSIECDEETGEVTIRSRSSITLEAPDIQVRSTGNATVESNGVLALEGSLITLN